MKKIVASTVLALLVALAAPVAVQAAVIVVQGDISTDTTWSEDNTYVLSGAVFVRGATLTIEPGTLIVGESATNGTLVIDRGAKIMANGTAKKPIVFTSDQPVGERGRGDWGGLIINGFAPLNVPGGEAEGEGDTGTYGGNDPADNSGVLRYVRVEFAGTEFSPDNELNGIAFQGVGSGTIVEFVQVHFNKDDGIEFFGGTVNVMYAVCTAIGDDSFDATDGWTGYGQFWIGQQRGDDADQGIEFDNNAEDNTLKPWTQPMIYNVTLIGDPDSNEGGESDLGMLLREGTAGTFANFIVTGFKEWGIEITDDQTHRNARRGELIVSNTIFSGNGAGLGRNGRVSANWSDNADDTPSPATTTAGWMNQWASNTEVAPLLRKPFNLTKPNFRPKKKSPAVDGTVPVATPPDNGFFDTSVNFIGALGAKRSADWTLKWTSFEQS